MKTRSIQNAFTSGVLSPLLKGRTDLEQYYHGLEIARNWLLMPQGGIKRRAGTKFIDKALPILTRKTTAPTMPEGGTAANINDENDGTSTTTTTNISTVSPYVVAKYDLGAATYIEVADVRGIFLTSSSSSDFKIQYSTDDISYTDAASLPTLTSSSQNIRIKIRANARYFRLARIGSADLGVAKVTLSDFNLWESSGFLSNVKQKDFSVATDTHYLMVFTDENCRIYKNGIYQTDIKTPYTSAQVKSLRDVQSETVIVLFHEDVEPRRIINSGSSWTIDTPVFTAVPQFDYNDSLSPAPINDVQVMTFVAFVAGDTFQIDIEGVLSKNITFAGDTTAAEQNSTAENIRKNIQDMPVVGETGVAVARTGVLQYTITISGESTKAFELFSAFATSGTASKTITFTHSATGSPRKEDVWSATRGFPKTACYYDGRLVLGGTKSKPQSVFFSKAGTVFNFDLDESDDEDAIFATISSRTLSNIVDVFPSRRLQIFTDGSEFTVNASPVTPSSISITPQTSHGSLNLEAKEIDGATFFCDRNGKSLKQFIYSFNEDSYIANDISALTPELIKTPVDLAILGGTSSDSANWVFIVNNDGSATVLNTLRSQDINGFTEWTTSGFITDVSVVDDQLYMINKRTIGGVETNFIEQWDFDYYTDNGLILDNSGASSEISGLDHLEGATVKVAAIDPTTPLGVIALPDRVVSGGKITLTTTETRYTKIQVGLEFIPTLKPMPLNTNTGSGQNSMRRKKILRMNMRVNQTSGLYVDDIPLPVRFFDEAASSPLDSFPIITSGVIDDILSTLGWGVDEMPTFTVKDPTPATILAIEYEVESS